MARYKSGGTSPVFIFIMLLILCVVGYFVSNKMTLNQQTGQSQTELVTKAELGNLVKQYLTENPEAVVNALEAFQTKKNNEAQQKAVEATSAKRAELEAIGDSPVVGSDKADVTIVEFFDYKCKYCQVSNSILNQLLEKDKNLRVIYKELPILGDMSLKAAKASLAVYFIDKAKFDNFHNALMSTQQIDDNFINSQLARLGIDLAKFKEIVDSERVQNEINRSRVLAGEISLRGTPTFVINGELYLSDVSLESLSAKINEARSKMNANSPAAAPQGTPPAVPPVAAPKQ